MKTSKQERVFWFSHLVVYGFAVLWAFAFYKYNWLNIGGGKSEYMECWILLSGVVPDIALLAWLSVFVAPLVFKKWLTLTRRQVVIHALSCLGFFPVILIVADWFFHRGFPLPPT